MVYSQARAGVASSTHFPELFGEVKSATEKLLAYCRKNDWAGHDPYDALNSRIFLALPWLNSRIPRLVLTQALKRSPVNIRSLALIPPTQNPKAISLFLRAALQMSQVEGMPVEGLISHFLEKLIELRSTGTPYWCWGYSFPWQTRTIVVPRGAPNLVCTTFIASALLDLYETQPDPRLLEMAASSAEYMLNDLYWRDGSLASFSYPLASLRVEIHNANFLASALLCRVYKHTGEKKFVEPALAAARSSAARQQADGSWYYGEKPTQKWVDNFHTGYNLSGLRQIDNALGTDEFEPVIQKGFDFYKTHFFREDGAARYFHDKTYPIDIHCVAQSILSPLEFLDLDPGNLELSLSAFRWALKNMWDERGFFYYRVLRTVKIRTSYMRWSQAWMLLALSTLLHELQAAAQKTEKPQSQDVVSSR